MGQRQSGIALILVLLVVVILYVVTTQVVTTSQREIISAVNDASVARMDLAMHRALETIVQTLIDDTGAEEEGGGGEGAGGVPGGIMPGGAGGMDGGAGGAGGGGGEEESASPSDTRNDPWMNPQTYSEDNITVYAHVVDENRKFNILTLISPDEEFARESMERFVRLVDTFREDTVWDLSMADAELLANDIKEFLEGRMRPEEFGIPEQVSDKEGSDIRLPKSVDELLLLENITPLLFYDQIRGQQFYPGLSSMITVWTSQTFPQMEEPEGRKKNTWVPPGGGGNAGQSAPTPAPETGSEEESEGQPLGLGVAININTAPRAVLRSLISEMIMPDQVLEAILEYRNEEVEEEEEEGSEEAMEPTLEDELLGGDQLNTREFTSLEDLEEVEEFKNWGVEEEKEKFLSLLSVQSDVFTIYLAATIKIDEEKHAVFVRRAKAVLRRETGAEGGEPRVVWIVPLVEQPAYLVINYPDFPELEWERQEAMEFDSEFGDMTAGDIYWNPFRFEFYYREDEHLKWNPDDR